MESMMALGSQVFGLESSLVADDTGRRMELMELHSFQYVANLRVIGLGRRVAVAPLVAPVVLVVAPLLAHAQVGVKEEPTTS